MLVNSHIFFSTTSFNLKFSSIMNMQGRGETKASNGLKTTISAFIARKINVETIVGDKDFEAVNKALRPVHVEIVGYDEYEGHVERIVRTVKERKRCDFQNIPYKKFPKLMMV